MLLVNGAKVKGDILRTLHFLNGTTSAFQRPLRGVTVTVRAYFRFRGIADMAGLAARSIG